MNNGRTAMHVDLLIQGGKVVTPGGIFTGWIGVQGGRIVALGTGLPAPAAERVIDVGGKYVLPGIIDPEGHLATGGRLRENLISETVAAVASGVTTWGQQITSTGGGKAPIKVRGPEDVPLYMEVLPVLLELGEQYSMVDYYAIPNLIKDSHADEIPQLVEKYGVTSFKTMLHLKSGPGIWHMWPTAKDNGAFGFDDRMIYTAMKHIARIGPPGIYCLHCENWEIAKVIQEELINQGRKDMEAWSDRSPGFCEAGHVRTYAYYAKVTGCPIYIQHVSTPETIEEIRKAKAEGVKIFCQTNGIYLSLTKDIWKTNVPLRDSGSVESCWQALRDGVIDCVASDHIVMRLSREKMEVKGDVWATVSGFPSRVEALLPIMLSEGVNKGRISMERLAEVCSENPARIFGLYPKKGVIAPGSDADFVVVDLDKVKTVTRDMIYSDAGWSIWEGWEIKGWPVMSILRGNVMMEWPEGEPRAKIVGKPTGQYIRRKVALPLPDIQLRGRENSVCR